MATANTPLWEQKVKCYPLEISYLRKQIYLPSSKVAEEPLKILAVAATVERSTHNGLINIDITIPDFQVETTIRSGADPGFVVNSGSLTAKIRQGHQVSSIAFLTLGKTKLFHEVHLPAKFESTVVYTR